MSEEQKEILKKVEKYEKLTAKALEVVKIKEGLNEVQLKIANDFLDMARNYFKDGMFFKEKGDLLTALASFSYAHAWLDAGSKAQLFLVKNEELFTLP